MRVPIRLVRNHTRMVERNCNILSLADAVARAANGGPFLMAERSDEGGFESSTNEIDPEGVITHLSKVETALRGIDVASGILATAKSPDKSDPSSSPAPAEPAE